jgi:hypothetical protein
MEMLEDHVQVCMYVYECSNLVLLMLVGFGCLVE